jgi:hypothetical protein
MAAERRPEAMSRKFFAGSNGKYFRGNSQPAFRILNRMVILLYCPLLLLALSRGKHAPRTSSAAGP